MAGHLSGRVRQLFLDKALFGHHPFAPNAQKAAQWFLGGPRDVVFEFRSGPAKGYSFHCQSSHRYFFLREWYEVELLEPLERLVHPGMTVYDIGAHFGFWALALSRLCGAAGKVFAFEPVHENREWLARNLAMNSVRNVSVVPVAVYDKPGTIYMSNDGTTSAVGRGDVPFEATTIDRFCRENLPPELLLIDVEGFAGAVLRGAAETFARQTVPVICEIHHVREAEEFNDFMRGRKIRKLGVGNRFPYHVLAT